ncbi:uncharacterized protein LOC128962999 [Oppia nitens]|uniref:uncharacterized protein LOC128954829 n=1 Tax=Oppia nitens TaxID=1686743 RepID=UPI0023DAF68B|nr:uncharacterized protein LOC128954829 [Oppia nitens]XP_054165431.1 uncharacterized protein LOC128962999 [Oppia nitens]
MTTINTGFTRYGTPYLRRDISTNSDSDNTVTNNTSDMSINGEDNDTLNLVNAIADNTTGISSNCVPIGTTGNSATNGSSTTGSAPMLSVKIPKFNGTKDSSLRIEAFLLIFDRVFAHLTDDNKLIKIVEFLESDAANYYGSDLLIDTSINWIKAKQLLTNRYTRLDIPPEVAANRRRQQRSESIRAYFDDKMEILRRLQNYTDNQRANLLTEGLLPEYREYFYGRRFKTPSQWLEMAQDIETDKQRTGNRINRPHGSSHYTDDKRNDNRLPKRDNKDKLRPPYSCRICRDLGITSWHYHKDCPNKSCPPAAINPNTGSTDGPPTRITAASSHIIRSKVMATEATPLDMILIPGRINRFELSAFADPGSTVDIIPLDVVKHLRLHIDRRRSTDVSLARGSARTLGEVTFDLTINRMTRTIKAQVINGFHYTLLLSLQSLGQYGVIIDTQTQTVSFKWQQQRNSSTSGTSTGYCNLISRIPSPNRLPNKSNGHIYKQKHRIVKIDQQSTAQRTRQSHPFAAKAARQAKDHQIHVSRDSRNALPITSTMNTDGKPRLCKDYRPINTTSNAAKPSHPYKHRHYLRDITPTITVTPLRAVHPVIRPQQSRLSRIDTYNKHISGNIHRIPSNSPNLRFRNTRLQLPDSQRGHPSQPAKRLTPGPHRLTQPFNSLTSLKPPGSVVSTTLP